MAWALHKDRHKDKRDRMGPKINPHIHVQLIFNKGAQNTPKRKNSLSTAGIRTTAYLIQKNSIWSSSYIIYIIYKN